MEDRAIGMLEKIMKETLEDGISFKNYSSNFKQRKN